MVRAAWVYAASVGIAAVIGSVVSVGACMVGVKRGSFIFWVTVSKVIRNWLLVFLYLLLAGRALDIQF
jgi:hypothetical protein